MLEISTTSWFLMISQSALLKFCLQTEQWFQIPGVGTDAAREALKTGTLHRCSAVAPLP